MLAIACARAASHPQQGIVGSFRIWKRNTGAPLCSTRVIGIKGSCLHLINNCPSIIDESWSSGPPLGPVRENKTPKDRRWMNNADEMPIRVLKSRKPCSANYMYWIMMITLMLSHVTPWHFTPCLNLTFSHLAPLLRSQKEELLFLVQGKQLVACVAQFSPESQKKEETAPQQRSFNQGQPDYRRLKCVEGASLGLAYNSDRAR